MRGAAASADTPAICTRLVVNCSSVRQHGGSVNPHARCGCLGGSLYLQGKPCALRCPVRVLNSWLGLLVLPKPDREIPFAGNLLRNGNLLSGNLLNSGNLSSSGNLLRNDT